MEEGYGFGDAFSGELSVASTRTTTSLGTASKCYPGGAHYIQHHTQRPYITLEPLTVDCAGLHLAERLGICYKLTPQEAVFYDFVTNGWRTSYGEGCGFKLPLPATFVLEQTTGRIAYAFVVCSNSARPPPHTHSPSLPHHTRAHIPARLPQLTFSFFCQRYGVLTQFVL